MALVPVGEGNGFFLSLTVTDRNGDESSLEFSLRAATNAEAVTQADTIRAAFAAVSDAVITRSYLSLRTEEDSFAYPAVGEVQVKARVVYQIDGETTKQTFDIPAPKEAIFEALQGKKNKEVDIADADVQAYANLFKATGVAFISDGEDLDFMVEGRKVTVKSGLRSGR